MIGRRGSKLAGIVLAGPEKIDAAGLREAVENASVMRAAGVALDALQRAVAGLDRRTVLALTGGDLAELARLAGLPAVVAEFQRRVADELVHDGAVRLKFDAGCRDLVEAASAAERVLKTEMVRDKARTDERMSRLRAAGVSEADIAGLPDVAAPDRAAERARVDALKVEAEQARAFLADPLRRPELLPASIAPKG